ncbi:MAG TPA: hypothetical protein VKU01_32510 [Bryobacteraceae bacterium]|nr:hypothetical protein [Bryobacteraceae bacterium]
MADKSYARFKKKYVVSSPKKSFYGCFKESLESLGLPAPDSLFKTSQEALKVIAAIAAAVAKLGTKVTIGEVIGAGTPAEGLIAAAGVSTAFYLGACIGALLYAHENAYGTTAILRDIKDELNALKRYREGVNEG